MKKLSAILCVIVMCGCQGAAEADNSGDASELSADISAQETPAKEYDDELMKRFINAWAEISDTYERKLSQEKYTLELIRDFSEAHSWDSLVRARAAAACTCRLLEYLADREREEILSESDLAVLEGYGIDTADLRMEFELYDSVTRSDIRDADLTMWRKYYRQILMFLVYEKNMAEEMGISAEAYAEHCSLEMKYRFLVNNIILLDMPEPYKASAESFFRESMPCIMASYPQLFTDKNDVMNEMNSLMKAFDELEAKLGQAAVVSEVNLDAADFTKCIRIDGLPAIVPAPLFMDGSTLENSYYYSGESPVPVTELMEMETIPDNVAMTFPDTSADDYRDYLEYLDSLGYEMTRVSDTSAARIVGDETVFLVQWTGTGVQLAVSGGQLCVAPEWYITCLLNESFSD